MNAELEKIFAFPCVLVGADSSPWINHYDVEILMRVTTAVSSDYNTAYGRMKFWFQDIMHGAVLIHSDNPGLQTWRDTGMTCLDFPTNPVDQVMGFMLMAKLTAMVEHRLEILRVSVCSPADDYVTYLCDHVDDLHWFQQPGWWSDPGPAHCTASGGSRKSGKVIALNRSNGWQQHDLAWTQPNELGSDRVTAIATAVTAPDQDPDA